MQPTAEPAPTPCSRARPDALRPSRSRAHMGIHTIPSLSTHASATATVSGIAFCLICQKRDEKKPHGRRNAPNVNSILKKALLLGLAAPPQPPPRRPAAEPQPSPPRRRPAEPAPTPCGQATAEPAPTFVGASVYEKLNLRPSPAVGS